MEDKLIKLINLNRYSEDSFFSKQDLIMVEEPLQINTVNMDGKVQPLSITMRTPGNDEELAIGFLFNESIIDIDDQATSETNWLGEVNVHLNKPKDTQTHARNFYMTSSCGVCGKTAIDLAITSCHYIPKKLERSINPSTLGKLPELLKKEQILFHLTGGIHACGIFNLKNELIYFAEDVGRHNALDKVAGWCLENQLLPMSDHILILSGRASFELIQKAMCMGIPVICSVGAPSSLAIELAESQGITLIGFLKSNKMNIYSGYFRLESE